ncbi:MAG TPA: hypothetical protein VJN62_04195 [Gemmatimonadales bacterium]|nr:hypothetical protein [Gemmatimonadales bacterium]
MIWWLFGAFWVIALTRLFLAVRVLSRLRRLHPSLWKNLGAPSVMGRGRSGEKLTLSNVLSRRRYEEADDIQLTRLGNAWRVLTVVFVGFLAVLAVLFLVFELRPLK